MGKAFSAKKLLKHYNDQQYTAFSLNDDEELILPQVSLIPGRLTSKRTETYTKKIVPEGQDHHVKFISKNNKPFATLWQSSPQKIKEATRWGIIKTESITGKVISALGKYRVAVHNERIAKGMVSNTQSSKLKLLDLYQDRFEALQALESLVNKNNQIKDYEHTFALYIKKLQTIKTKVALLNQELRTVNNNLSKAGLDTDSMTRINDDIDEDIDKARDYLMSLSETNLRACNRAKGEKSILEFIKEQMNSGLYELQGINQDMSFSLLRETFSLTRGELNDYIEDARQQIEKHQADPRNNVTNKHHGLFSDDENTLVVYDFSKDNLDPKQEGDALMALSFIEGLDTVNWEDNTVSNGSSQEPLKVIIATRWQLHRNVLAWVKSTGYYFVNMFKSMFLSTRPWEEETWSNPDFHLQGALLRRHATPHEPIWKKPFHLLTRGAYALIDIVYGIKDFGVQLVIKTPDKLINDWNSSNSVPLLSTLLNQIDGDLKTIKELEKERLEECLKQCGDQFKSTIPQSSNYLAVAEYELTAQEQNDIMNALVRGFTEFGSVFSHNIFAKDPIGGMVFTASLVVGGVVIFVPAAATSVFGASYVNWFSNFSYAMGSSKTAAFVAGATTQAQMASTAWDGLINGPSGIILNALYQLGKDPLTAAVYIGGSYGLGYVLVNGIAGYPIPWLSAMLKEDLGSVPATGYPFIAAKLIIGLYEALTTHQLGPNYYPSYADISQLAEILPQQVQRDIQQFVLASWLSNNQEYISRLDRNQLFELSRQIDLLFSKEQAKSLKKMLYPEPERSIAYQLFSIPLSYIPSLLRVLLSPVLGAVAYGLGKEHPEEPMKRAASDLVDQIKKDLSRLGLFAVNLVYVNYLFITTFVKAIVFTAGLITGRIASLFGVKTAHTLHKGFAFMHNLFRTLGEFLYPARALKSVAIANPVHTIKEIDTSYHKAMQQLQSESRNQQSDKEEEEPIAFSTLHQCYQPTSMHNLPGNTPIISVAG